MSAEFRGGDEKRLASSGSGAAAALADYPASLLQDDLTGVVDTRALSQPHVDVMEWINTSLSRLGKVMPTSQPSPDDAATAKAANSTGTVKDTPGKSLYQNMSAVEQMVHLLYSHVQQHRLTLSDTVENLITQTVSRLPRTTLELSRMMEETDEVATRLQRVHHRVAQRGGGSCSHGDAETVSPSSPTATMPTGDAARGGDRGREDGAVRRRNDGGEEEESEQLTRRLRQLKVVESKLQGCCEAIDTSIRVEEGIAALDYAMTQMRRGEHHETDKDAHRNDMHDITAVGRASVDRVDDGRLGGSGGARRPFTDIDAMAEAIRAVKKDMAYLQSVEACYGQKHQTALERYEAFVETALERECLSHFSLHNVRRAAHVYHTLHTIDRADAMLQSYAQLAMQHTCDRIDRLLRRTDETSVDGGGGSNSNSMTVAEALPVLRSQILPSVATVLSKEFDFMQALAQELNRVASAAPLETVPGTTMFTTTTTAAALTKLMNLMDRMLSALGDRFARAMTPILRGGVTHNGELVSCYEAIRELRIAPIEDLPPSQTMPQRESAAAAGSSVTSTRADSLSARRTAAARVTASAVEVLTRVCHSEEILRDFCDRAHRQLLPVLVRHSFIRSHRRGGGVVTAKEPEGTTVRVGGAGAGEDEDEEEVYRARVSTALQQSMREVMRYFPEHTAVPCLQSWSASLMDVLVTPLRDTCSDKEAEAALTSVTELVESLYVSMTRVRPMLLQWQRELAHDLLTSEAVVSVPHSSLTATPHSSTHVHENIPQRDDRPRGGRDTIDEVMTSAKESGSLTASSPQSRVQPSISSSSSPPAAKEWVSKLNEYLWSPVLIRLDADTAARQRHIQRRLLAPVLAKTASYTALPVWGRRSTPDEPLVRVSRESAVEPYRVIDAVGRRRDEEEKGSGNGGDAVWTAATPNMTAEAVLSGYELGQSTPSQPVRDLGEAIMEVPLMLDALCAELANAVHTSRAGVSNLLEELAESWLEHIVHAAVDDFVRNKVLRVHIYAASGVLVVGDGPLAEGGAARMSWSGEVAAALRQVETDLSYLKNVLSAVNEERFEQLESVLEDVRELSPGDVDSTTPPLILGQFIYPDRP